MRIIAELPHAECKISIFSMNQKYIIKFEQGTLEQVYKLAELNVTDGVNGIFQIIDEFFIKSVLDQFKLMRSSFKEAYERHEY